MKKDPVLHGAVPSPIPVPIGVDEAAWEAAYVRSRVRDAEIGGTETQVEAGRTFHRTTARAKDGAEHHFCFDVTLRAFKPSAPARIVLTAEMRRKLEERSGRLPETGCFLCRRILELGPGWELRKSPDFPVLGKVRHLAVEGIAEFTIPCPHCEQLLPAHVAFASDDLSSCRLCEAIRMAEDKLTAGPSPATPKPVPPPRPRRGRRRRS